MVDNPSRDKPSLVIDPTLWPNHWTEPPPQSGHTPLWLSRQMLLSSTRLHRHSRPFAWVSPADLSTVIASIFAELASQTSLLSIRLSLWLSIGHRARWTILPFDCSPVQLGHLPFPPYVLEYTHPSARPSVIPTVSNCQSVYPSSYPSARPHICLLARHPAPTQHS